MRPKAELLFLLLLGACGSDPLPKPKGWLRLDLPPVEYLAWNSAHFSVEVPTYAKMAERSTADDARWYDLRFPQQRATVHFTWSPIGGRLPELIEDAHDFKRKHEAKAARINSERMLRDSTRVFGTLFDVEGDVASPFVMYLTDSTDNFLYAALYFDTRPNADSLAPVTERIRQDMRHFAATLRWIRQPGP
jgi:gliding motility-associated lipoprotein GldD